MAVRNRLAIGPHCRMRTPLVTAESLGPWALGSSCVVMVAMVVSSCFACAVLGERFEWNERCEPVSFGWESTGLLSCGLRR